MRGRSVLFLLFLGVMAPPAGAQGWFVDADVYPIEDPGRIESGDLDLDGDIDLVVSQPSSGRLLILWNDGGGLFDSQTPVPGGPEAWFFAIADLDGDGDSDLAISNSASQLIIVRNLGGGLFVPADTLQTGADPRGIAARDLDDDGAPDLAVVSNGENRIETFWNDGNGGFSAGSSYPCTAYSSYIVAAPLIMSPLPDLAVGGWDEIDQRITVYENLGNRTFGTRLDWPLGYAIQKLHAADIDEDGDLDIVAQTGDGIRAIFNLGWWFFSDPVTLLNTGVVASVGLADLDGDGHLDILAGPGSYCGFRYVPGVGDATFDPRFGFAIDIVGWRDIAAADLDGDTDPDFATTGYTGVSVVRYRGDRRLDAHYIYTSQGLAASVATGDIDRDGDADVVRLSADGILDRFRNEGNGLLLREEDSDLEVQGVTSSWLGDIDLDGDPDYLVASTDMVRFTISFNNGSGHFTYPIWHFLADYPGGFVLERIDADAAPDLAIALRGAQESPGTAVSFWRNNGCGGFDHVLDQPVAGGPDVVRAADLDRDGDLDLAMTHAALPLLTLLRNTGTGFAFEPYALLATSGPAMALVSEKLDGDPFPDLACRIGGEIHIFWNEEGVFPGEPTIVDIGGSSPYLAAGDLDGDGDNDLLAALREGPRIALAINQGGRVFEPGLTFETGCWNSLEFAYPVDLDGDGLLDIVAGNQSGGYLNVVFNGLPAGAGVREPSGGALGRFDVYPNPTNGSRQIRFVNLPEGHGAITIHDLSGRTIRTLVVRRILGERGTILWDGRNDRGTPVAPGVYLARVGAGRDATTRVVITR